MSHNIATVINFCSNEYRFLESCIFQAKKFSKKIYITVCDHFFDGEKEDTDLLSFVFSKFDDCQFIYYPFLLDKISKKLQKKIGDNFCCTLSRFLGYFFSDKTLDYLLFLDADEIVDGEKFSQWLDVFPYKDYSVIRPANYWYFRKCCFRAKKFEDSAVFAKRKLLNKKVILQDGDRNAIYENIKGMKKRMVLADDKSALIHHYSWVRTKEEMLKKVLSWGHRNERDWVELVEKEFSKPFSGKDFVHGYDFEKVCPFVDILLESKQDFSKKDMSIEKISGKTLLNSLKTWAFFSKKRA